MGGQFPPALEAVISKMLSKTPSDRYQRLVDTANDLIDLQQGKAPSAAIVKKIEKGAAERRNKIVSMALLTGTALAIAGTAMFFSQGKKQPETPASKASIGATPDLDSPTASLEAETVAEVDKHFQVDYSDVIEEYFSSNTKQGTIPHRVFKFPEKSAIGRVSYYDLQNHFHDDPAKGQVTVPKFPTQPSIIAMTIDWRMCKTSPQLLKKFRTDEIGYLKFTDDDSRKTLASGDIFDDALSFVDNLKSIFSIDLPTAVSNKSVPHLANLPKLISLGASRTGITGDELKKLPTLMQMRNLRISMIKNANAVLPELKQSQSLKTLKLVADDIEDSDLKYLANLPKLEELALRDNPKITDVGLTHLVGLPRLSRISLDGCNITPKSIKTLGKLNVSDFICLDVSRWPKADVAALQRAVPCRLLSWNYEDQKPGPIDAATRALHSPAGDGLEVRRKKAIDRGE